MSMNRLKQPFQGLPRWNLLVQWRRELSMQLNTIQIPVTDQKYQLVFVVNFVKLHLTHYIIR